MIQQTSRAANNDMEVSGKKLTHSQIILNAMISNNYYEGNYEALARLCGLKDAQVWKRLSELAAENLIEDSGKTALLSSGKMGIVWRVKITKQSELF